MRIAISGSHSLGKSTFVRDFLMSKPSYAFEEEPYRALMNDHEIRFAEGQRVCDIDLQLNYLIGQVKKYDLGSNVIFDRCPADYIPYSKYSAKFGSEDIDEKFVESLFPKVQEALSFLDLIVFIPIVQEHPILLEDDGHRPTHDIYRDWVDGAFKTLYRDQMLRISPLQNPPKLIEIWGDRQTRLNKIEKFL